MPTLSPSLNLNTATQDWWDLTAHGQLRSWDDEIPDPFKTGRYSPLRSIPGADSPKRIQPDIMHCFNLGFGKDLAASSLLLLCRLRKFPGRSMASKLNAAYDDFEAWCADNGKSSSIKQFDLKTFKIKSCLVQFP